MGDAMKLNRIDGIIRFDFGKKPVKPCFLMQVAKWLISWPDLKKRGFRLEKTGMERIIGPYLLLVTHSSMVDFNVMLKATHPAPVNNVMTLEGFHTYTEPLMRSLGVLGTRKYINDIHLIKNIRYCLDKLGTIFVLFPEARYSLDGCTSYLPSSVGKLIRLLKVPVVVLRIHGSFVTCPQWNKIDKKTYVEAEMRPILMPEQIRSLSASEINTLVKEQLQYDDFQWQREKGLAVTHPRRADGLHSLLYKCPACQSEGQTDSEGTQLWCNACGKKWEMDEYGSLHALSGETEFSHIPDWSTWERACVRREIEAGSYYFEDEVRVETLPSSLRFYPQGKGRLTQTPVETRLECTCYGKPYTLVRTAKDLESMHIEYDYLNRGDCIDISIPNDSFWCYLSRRDAITKISFATEEMHKLAAAHMP